MILHTNNRLDNRGNISMSWSDFIMSDKKMKLPQMSDECDRTGYLRKRDTAGQAGETMENQRREAGNGWKRGGKVRI